MTKLEKVATSHKRKLLQFHNFMGLVFFVPLQGQFAENANKSYHVCKEIVVLHIYHTNFGIRQEGPPVNKVKILTLIKF